jgi:EmrB/QacA subfamily drug resistance transporter
MCNQPGAKLFRVRQFSIASLLCGLASSITALIVFRVIQGIGAAIMTPGTLTIIIRAFPPRQHGLAIGLYGGISGLGLIAGPVLGGLLVQGESWRWIFFVNVPLGVVALVMAVLFVPESREATGPVPVDWPGLLLLSSGLLCLLFGFTRAGDEGWTNIVVIGSCLFGIVLLALFAMTERRVRWPLVDLTLFRNRPFVMGCLSFFFLSAALFGSQPYWSLFMQNTWGFTPLQDRVSHPNAGCCSSSNRASSALMALGLIHSLKTPVLRPRILTVTHERECQASR